MRRGADCVKGNKGPVDELREANQRQEQIILRLQVQLAQTRAKLRRKEAYIAKQDRFVQRRAPRAQSARQRAEALFNA